MINKILAKLWRIDTAHYTFREEDFEGLLCATLMIFGIMFCIGFLLGVVIASLT